MKIRRLFSMLLALALLIGLFPTVAIPTVVQAEAVDTPAGVRNHLPSTAKDIVYLSDMTYEFSDNYPDTKFESRGYHFVKDGAWREGKIWLGNTEANGGTVFDKGLGVMPKNVKNADVAADRSNASYTVFDLADNNYAQSFFYSAVGITNNRTADTGVVFEVWASYDKSVEDYSQAEYVLLEGSGTVKQTNVYQFHLDVTGARYLKLVVYAAANSISGMNCAWGGACVYNNPGYYPKTDMISKSTSDGGEYEEFAERDPSRTPSMFNAFEHSFNTYNFNKIPADATMLATQTRVEQAANNNSVSTTANWVGGTHLAVVDSSGKTQNNQWQKDGIKFPANSSVYFNVRASSASDGATDGYVVYDVSTLNADTFYCIVGAVSQAYKYSEYNAENGGYGGMVFEVWGKGASDSDYRLLCESEPTLKSNTGEFIVDIAGVDLLKLRIRSKDPRSNSSATGVFAYACVFEELGVSVSGQDSVTRGLTANYAAVVRRDLEEVGDYTGTVTWTMTGAANANTTIDANGKLTVNKEETATSLQITASITEDGETITSAPFTVAVTKAPVGVRNHLPSTAKDVKYLSDMNWEYSINNTGVEATRDLAFKKTNVPIVMGNTVVNGGTTFTKGLGVQPYAGGATAATLANTVFDLADNNYAQNYFYAAAGITNDAAKSGTTVTNGVYFEVWASYDKDQEDYAKAEYVLLESSGKITQSLVYQFHLDVTGVRYLKLVVYGAQSSISYMDCNWAGACVYNNPGYYPKSDLMGNGKDNTEWVPSGEDRFNTYHFTSTSTSTGIPDDAISLSKEPYKDTSHTAYLESEGGKVVEFVSASGNIGNGAQWVGGASVNTSGALDTVVNDGIYYSDLTSFLRFNGRQPGSSDSQTDGWITFDISDLNVNRFYALVGFSNANAKKNAYNSTNGEYGGMKVQVWGAATKNGEYTLLSESEVIMLSQTGEFDVNITGVNFLKLRVQAKDARAITAADVMFCNPCVFYDEWTATVTGADSVLQGDNTQYTATITRQFAQDHNYTGPITWTVAGASGANTKLTDGKLVVDESEAAASLNVSASIVEGGHVLNSNTKAVTVISAGDNVAYVEENGHGTLAEAIAAANGGQVKLVKSVTLTEAVAVANETVTLDLNGKTVTGETVAALGAGADLTIVTNGGKLNGKLALSADGAKLTADCPITLEMNGNDATVNAKNVTLIDSATDNGAVGGKIYGDCQVTGNVITKGAIRYVILEGADDNGSYITANAVRVKVKRINVRPGSAGLYYTTEVIFNQNVANAGATYGVALSLANKPDDQFADDSDTLYTVFEADKGADFNAIGTSCLVTNILQSDASDETNATNGAKDIYANAYVQVNGVTIMMENDDVVYSLQTVMERLDGSLKDYAEGTGTLSENAEKALNFYEAWQGAMSGWNLPYMAQALAKKNAV